MEENKIQEEVVDTSQETTSEETEPQTNFDAKKIREATERKLLNKLGVDNVDTIKKQLEEYNQFKESQKSEEQRRQEEAEQVKKDLEAQRQEAETLKKQNQLRALGVQEEQLEDAFLLTQGMNDNEAIQNKVNSYFAKPVQNTGTNQKAEEQDVYASIRSQVAGFKGKI